MSRERLLKLIEKVEDLFSTEISLRGYNYTPKLQLLELGLEDVDIKGMASKQVLDIGCGFGNLVEHLRNKSVIAEGIDIDSPKKSYFMNQNITSAYPNLGCIPKENDFYDKILCHGLTPPLSNLDTNSIIILSEALRVEKPNGEMILFPSFSIDEKFLNKIWPGRYFIEKRDVWYWQESEKYLDELGKPHQDYSTFKYTTVIKKLA